MHYKPMFVVARGEAHREIQIWKHNVFCNMNLQNEQQQTKQTHQLEIQKSKTPPTNINNNNSVDQST